MSSENPDTKPKKGTNSAFRKFEQLAKKIVRVPRDKVRDDKRSPGSLHKRPDH